MENKYSELLRSLAKEGIALKNENETDKEEKKEPVKSETAFTLTLAEYPDIIISKKMPSGIRHLIIMPSAETCFIKIEPNKGEPRSEMLDAKNYCAFTAGMPDISMPEGYWCRQISRGKAAFDALDQLFKNATLLEIIRKGCLPEGMDAMSDNYFDREEVRQLVKAYTYHPSLLREFKGTGKSEKLILNEPKFVKNIEFLYGLDNTRDFLREYENSLANLIVYRNTYGNSRHSSNRLDNYHSDAEAWETEIPPEENQYGAPVSVIPGIVIPYKTFKKYVLYDSVRYGYALTMTNFFQTWRDTLMMEYYLYDKLVDKTPKNLQVYHDQLSYKCTIMKEEIDEKKFKAQSERAAMYEGTFGNFVLIAPKNRQDFYDEATAQGNCLAGYVEPFTEGRCLILFMRFKKAPDFSYITVEIVNGKVRQMKRAMNAEPTFSERQALETYIEKCNREAA